MARRNLSAVIRYLRRLSGSAGATGAGDAELLERYVRHRDEAAFELLLWRHGALVFNVCRRLLPREQDAEDAFQATFLAFVRKAGSISRRGSVAGWLYKVAYRVALEARERARKTAAIEQPGAEMLAVQAAADPTWSEVRPILDEELNHLPERLREAFVLCYLEGKTNEEAARQLGCPTGTIFSRLARGREMLRKRLLRRGVTLTLTALTAGVVEHARATAPAATLIANTVRAAFLAAAGQSLDGLSPQAAALAEGVLRSMFLTKIKMAALLVLLVGMLTAGGVLTRHALMAAPQPDKANDKGVLTRHAELAAPQPDNANDKSVASVTVVHPTLGGLQRTSLYDGHVRAVAQQQVYPVVSGYVKRLTVDIGDAVKKGDVLGEIDAPLSVLEVKQARAALGLEQKQVEGVKAQVETALAEVKAASGRIKGLEARLRSEEVYVRFREKQAARYKELFSNRAIDEKVVEEQQDRLTAAKEAVISTREEIQTARSQVGVYESKVQSAKVALETAMAKMDLARLAVEKAEIQLGFAVIHAHLDGIIIGRHVNSGDFVSASDPGARRSLLTVMRTDPVRIVVDVSESDAPFIHPGAAVHLKSHSLPDVKLPDCKVSRIGFAIDEKTSTMPVEIDVPNPGNQLRPGLSLRVIIHLDKKVPANTVTVPDSAVLKPSSNEQFRVYIVRDGKAHFTPVTVSYLSGDKIEISSGARPSDRLVADPRGLQGKVVPVEVKKAP